MIYARDENGTEYMGLSFENLDRLRAGNPILIKPETHKSENYKVIYAAPSMGDLYAAFEELTGVKLDEQ